MLCRHKLDRLSHADTFADRFLSKILQFRIRLVIDFCPTIAPRLPKQSPFWERFLRQFLFLYYRKEFLEWSDSILVLSSSNFCGSCAARLYEKYSFEWSWRGCRGSGNQGALETIIFRPYFKKSNRMLRRNGHMVVFSMISIQQDRTNSNGSRALKSIISLVWSIWSS